MDFPTPEPPVIKVFFLFSQRFLSKKVYFIVSNVWTKMLKNDLFV